MADSRQTITRRAAAITRAPRTRKVAIWLVAIIAAIGVLGGLLAPYVLRGVLSDQLTAKLHRPVTIEKIRINPYTMSATLQGFLMKERSGNVTAISFDELHVNLQAMSLFRLGLVLEELRLVKPYVNLVRQEDFKYNFQDLIDEFTSGPAGPKPRFALNNIQIIDGKIDFDDRPEQTKHTVDSLRLGVPFISSLPSYADIFVKPAFAAVVNGTPFDIKGDTKPFKDSLESVLQVNIDNLQISKYLGYSPVKLDFTVPTGRIDGKLTASFKAGKGEDSVLAIAADLALRDLRMQENNGAPLLNLPTLDVGVDSLGVFARKASVKTIKAQGLELYLRRRKDGSFNVANLTVAPANSMEAKSASDAETDKTKKEDRPFLYQVEQVLVESGKLHYTDETTGKAYQTNLDNLRIDVKNLNNEPNKKADVAIAFQTEAKERVEHSGALQLTPLLVEGKLDIQGLRPDGFKPYYQNALAAEIREGFLDLSTRYVFQQTDKGSDIKFSELAAAIRNLRLEEPDKKPLWRIPLLAVKDTAVDLGNKTIVIGSLEGREANGFIQRNADGTLNYDRLVKPQPGAPSAKEAVKKEEPGWKIEAKQIALNRFKVDFEDNVPSPPAKLSLSDLSVRGEGFSNIKNQRGKATIQAKINNGEMRLNGTAGADPVVAHFQVEGRDIDLTPLQPYLENQVNFMLTGGRLGTKGKFVFDASLQGPARVTYSGELGVSDFSTVEKNASQDLLKWKLLALGGIQLASNPVRLRIDEIDLAGFYSRLVLGADGKINLQNLAADKPAKSEGTAATRAPEGNAVQKATEPPSPSPAAPASEERVSIGKINLRDGNINFSDFFVKPNYTANLTGVQGTIGELKPEAPGDLALEAKLDNAAPVDIRGKINPMSKDLFMDIKAKASEIELSSFSPYSGKYVGYGIEKGQLTFDVAYKLENRKLDAQTQFILNQLTFGEKIDSPTATSLPVTLAVALLKDRNGVIDVGLPISGTLDDPQFSIGGIVWRLVINIITRAVTAPFALLGAAFGGGGGGAELSYIEFDFGRASLSQTAEAKIKTLAAAMNNRPGLKLEITGRAEPTSDVEGLRRASIENKVKAQKMKELARQGAASKPVEEVQVAKEEYERFLRGAYDAESFPKPRNLIGLAQSLPVSEMESLMLKHTSVGDDDVRALANRRAQTVRDRLLAAKIPADRLFIVAAKAPAQAEPEKAKGRASRVDFSLR
jgi:uncharacterized protein involved in outer membrane biogenesis